MGKYLELMGKKKCRRGAGTIMRRKSMVDIPRLAILTFLIFLSIGVNSAIAVDPPCPILFVHGSGDSAALWHTTLCRFEPGPPQPIRVTLNKETMTVLTYPLDSGHIVIAEFHY
jgi:hypothetical protein